MKYFVWVNGLRGPEPQIWSDELTKDGKSVATLFKHELTADDQVTLAWLAKRYSYEAKP